MIKKSPELAAVMKRILEAVERKDVATIRSMMPPSDHLLIIGSASEEWTYGANAVSVLLTQVEGLADYRYEYKRMEAYEAGAIGWAAVDVTGVVRETHHVPLRIVGVFKLEEGAWRVAFWHLSEARPNDPRIMGVELTETLSSLIDAINEGADLTVSAEQLPSSTVTLLFTDVEASTSHAVEMGDEAWGRIMREHFQDMQRIAADNDGVVVKTLGDGAMLAFTSVSGGLASAIRIQRGTQRLGDGGIRVRAGVHTGDALRSAGDYLGQSVDKAARVAAAAQPGQCLVTAATRSLVAESDGFSFDAAVVLELKGIPGVTMAYPLSIE